MTLLPKASQGTLTPSKHITAFSSKPLQISNTKQEKPEDLSLNKMESDSENIVSPAKRPLSAADESINLASSDDGAVVKKKRVENIVTSICQPRSPKHMENGMPSAEQRNKRKQFVPQQHGTSNGNIDVVAEEDSNQNSITIPPAENDQEKTLLKEQLRIMGEQLQKMQQRYQEMFEKREIERFELMSRLAIQQPQVEMESYLRAIRTEINQSVKIAVSETLEKSLPLIKEKAHTPSLKESLTRDSTPKPISIPPPSEQMKRPHPSISIPSSLSQHHGQPSLTNPLLPLPMYYSQALSQTPFNSGLNPHFNNNMMSASALQAAIENEMIENQLYNRDDRNKSKKRTKVTDTRLSPRTSKTNENSSPIVKPDIFDQTKTFDAYGAAAASLFPGFNASNMASMAAMQNAFFNGLCGATDSMKSGTRSPTNMSDLSDRNTSSPDLSSVSLNPAMPGQNVTLTPLHLRKAKLMFFYVRYPSSVLLKNYFCDVHFNKNNTAQLVKWFSNFREFYYIQMEKYARQYIAEGLTADQVEITVESELYKILNLHYNRNNQIEVPKSFLETIQVTLKEFIRAIALGKDREQSWKKPIYKVIARLDDTVPEYFKSQDWMEQLSD